MLAAKIPTFKFPLKMSDTIPTKVGPDELPISPPKARSANMAVPPLDNAADALLNVPGHIIPTESPQAAQAIKLSCGMGSSEIPK